MAVIVAIVIGCLLALTYSRKGLFLASMALVSILLGSLAGLGFAAAVERTIPIDSPHRYSAVMLGIAIFVLAIVRGALAFIDEDIEFYSIVDRIGGAVMGMIIGLLATGFVYVCLLCSPQIMERIKLAEPNLRQASAAILIPCRQVARIIPGEKPFDLEIVISPNKPIDAGSPKTSAVDSLSGKPDSDEEEIEGGSPPEEEKPDDRNSAGY